MTKLRISLLLVLLVVVSSAIAGRDQRGGAAARRRKNNGAGRQKCECSVKSECVLPQGQACGLGSRNITCTPSNNRKCLKKSGIRPCKVKCEDGTKCKYSKPTWGNCDPVSKSKTGTKNLVSGNQQQCPQTHTLTKKCRIKCKYNKVNAEWSACDTVTNMKTKVIPLVRPTDGCPQFKNLTKKCSNNVDSNTDGCKYKKKVKFGDCDPATNEKSRVRQKIAGGESCPPTITDVKPCKAKDDGGCKYEKKVQFGDCDSETNQKTRIRQKIAGDDTCPLTRTDTKPCRANKKVKKMHCVYQKRVQFGECNTDTNEQSRTRRLISGGKSCPPSQVDVKSCKTKVQCTYGNWTGFGDCQNGVRTNTREVLSGSDVKCERRASKTKPC
ncbi:uncharacterized protein LOC141906907 [Tubulanus polymorphus]|uniref:uncharacterized protein LOC141906907 n=1 Tax=Tubulanus polymorphus TaxID=672921 RepID=UPI003DA31C53